MVVAAVCFIVWSNYQASWVTRMNPGIHDISHQSYIDDDLCPEPSLSASGICMLMKNSPMYYAANTRRLSKWPNLIRKSTGATEKGTATHAIILGEGDKLESCHPSQFKTAKGVPAQTFGAKEAAAGWQAIIDRGLIPITPDDLRDAQEAANAARERLILEYGEWPIGESEKTYFWQEDTVYGPIWMRARLDHPSVRLGILTEIKTTEKGLSDHEINESVYRYGWPVQNVVHSEGFEAIHPEWAGKSRFRNFYQQTLIPYDNTFIDIPEHFWMYGRDEGLAGARKLVADAKELFARCLYSGEWPGRGAHYVPHTDYGVTEEIDPDAEEILR